MLVDFQNVTFGYAGVPTVENVTFALNEGERVGLLGGNGEGKTTLLRLLVGELKPDAGTVTRKNRLRLGYLEQSGGLESEATVYRAMEEVFDEDKALIARLAAAQSALSSATGDEYRALAARCESLERQIAARDSYRFDVKIKTVLNGMGFEEFYGRVVSTMSGGEKTKLKLCRLLLEEPELLILDEPTNHLDIKTLFWLEEYLSRFKGALLVVSHDRYFLDRLTSRTLELEYGKVTSYKGNYSKYRVLKEERFKEMTRAYERQQEEIGKLQTYVEKNIVRATTAKSALSRVNKLERMDLLEKPLPPPAPPRFRFTFDEPPYERVLEAEKFDLTVGGKTLLSGASFLMTRGQKIALVGDNGTGKTSLLKFFLSSPAAVKFARFVRLGYYDQENADLPQNERVLDAFWGKNVGMTQTEARSLLARAGLNAEDVQKKVSELSGGLKAKLSLAILEARRANVLFLDEPTNHLDLPAREALEEALKTFEGTLLFVSHDRRFIEAVATRIVSLEGGALVPFEGGYDEFLAAREKQTPPAEKPEKKSSAEGYRTKEERAREAQARNRTREIEARIALLEEEEKQLDERLAEVAADYKEVQKVTSRQEEVRAEIEALYAEYETLI